MKRIVLALFAICLSWSMAHAQSDVQDPRIENIRALSTLQLALEPGNRALRFRYAQASFQAGFHDVAKSQ